MDPSNSFDDAARIIDLIHSEEYVQAVRTGVGRLRSTNGFSWDEGIPQMALAHMGGMVAARNRHWQLARLHAPHAQACITRVSVKAVDIAPLMV